MSNESGKVEYKKEWCKYEFSAEEKRDNAQTLAIKTQDLEQAEDEKKSVMSTYKERIDKIALEVKSAARMYKDGYEMRDIECVVERDFDSGVVKFVRTDNGEIARTSKMTMAERQLTVDDALDKNDAPFMSDTDLRQQMETNIMMTSETSAL